MEYIKKAINYVFDKIEELGKELLDIGTQTNQYNNALVPLDDESSKISSRRHLEDLNIDDLYAEINRYIGIVKSAKDFIVSLPSLSDIFKIFQKFFDFCLHGVENYIKRSNDKLLEMQNQIENNKILSIQSKIVNSIHEVQNFVVRELYKVKDSLLEIPELTKDAAFEILHERIRKYINEAKRYLAKLIIKLLDIKFFDFGDQYEYPIEGSITIPVGPVPLKFTLGVTPSIFYKFRSGLEDLNLFVEAEVGTAVEAFGRAGVSVLLLEVSAYIKGLVAKLKAKFYFKYLLEDFIAKTGLCLTGEFGDVKCGVHVAIGVKFLEPVCRFIEKSYNVCKKILGWLGGWACNWVKKIVKVCDKFVEKISWSKDFLDFQIIKPKIIQKCLPFN